MAIGMTGLCIRTCDEIAGALFQGQGEHEAVAAIGETGEFDGFVAQIVDDALAQQEWGAFPHLEALGDFAVSRDRSQLVDGMGRHDAGIFGKKLGQRPFVIVPSCSA